MEGAGTATVVRGLIPRTGEAAERRAELVTGGTDNHMLVVDTVQSFGIDGREAETLLDRVGIAVNRQIVPDDPNPPLRPSGIRLGTPAATTRGMGPREMERLAEWICHAIARRADEGALLGIAAEVEDFCTGFPVSGLSERDEG